MTDTKWTPGPWRAGEWGNGWTAEGEKEIFSDGAEVVVVQRVLGQDAHLIAAAPELYKALDNLVRWTNFVTEGDYEEEPEAITEARAALAKARGENDE